MAERALSRIPHLGPTASEPSSVRVADLWMAIRQLERAELYRAALSSLDLGDKGVDQAVDDLVRDVRGLRQGLIQSKLRQQTALDSRNRPRFAVQSEPSPGHRRGTESRNQAVPGGDVRTRRQRHLNTGGACGNLGDT